MDPIPIHPVDYKGNIIYGLTWPTDDQLAIERQMIRAGGYVRGPDGQVYGMGLPSHMKRFQSLLWPMIDWHRWTELLLRTFCEHKQVGVLGPASSSKSFSAAIFGLTMYFAHPRDASIMVSSTDARSLELRIWGEMKKYYQLARNYWEDCPGRLVESKQMIVTDTVDEDATDFRNGIIGIPCVQSGQFVGLGKFVGVKNQHVLLLGDELQFMAPAYMDSLANLSKNPTFHCIGMGNPKDPTDCLGKLCEPHPELGGWDGVTQGKKTQVWRCRMPNTVAVQLVGTDSPNFDYPPDQPKRFPYLIGRKEIANDLEYHGEDSINFQMFDLGVMPKNAQIMRIFNHSLFEEHNAYDKPIWRSDEITHLVGLDASYSAVGGDRNILFPAAFGIGRDNRMIFAQTDMEIVVPVRDPKASPEDQIALWVMEWCQRHEPPIPPERLFIDSTGRGTMVNAFGRIWSPHIQCVEFGGRPTDRIVSNIINKPAHEHFADMVSELWFVLRYLVEAGQVRGISRKLVDEACHRNWELRHRGKIEVESKRDMKKRMGYSPDITDACVCAVEGARRLGLLINRAVRDDEARADNLKWTMMRDKMKELRQAKSLRSHGKAA